MPVNEVIQEMKKAIGLCGAAQIPIWVELVIGDPQGVHARSKVPAADLADVVALAEFGAKVIEAERLHRVAKNFDRACCTEAEEWLARR